MINCIFIYLYEVITITEQVDKQDIEWARDWNIIVNIFKLIENLKEEFKQLDVTYLREIQQKIILLNLEKYAWSLENYIVEKYSKE